MKNKRVGGALGVAIVLVVGAIVLSDRSSAQPMPALVIVADQPREYQKTKDTDQDGMRDWEEELRGTNPLVPNKGEPVVLAQAEEDKETLEDIPDTMTNRFAVEFFSEYISKNAGDTAMDADYKEKFLNSSIEKATTQTQDTYFTRSDVKVSAGNDVEAVREYGNVLGAVFMRYPVKDDNEVAILERALQKDDANELKALDPIIDSYKRTTGDVLATPAPAALVSEHLNLLNALITVHNSIKSMRASFDDPLPAMVRVQRYQSDVANLSAVFKNLASALSIRGVVYGETEPGSLFTLLPL